MSTITGNVLLQQGWPQGSIIGLGLKAALALEQNGYTHETALALLDEVRQHPTPFVAHPQVGALAQAWLAMSNVPNPIRPTELRKQPLPYQAWGKELVEAGAITQMENAARLPIARAAALMPDAHVGYGLPIGGVLATENSVIPYAVGVDIACRMRLSIVAASPHLLDQKRDNFEKALLNSTRFGAGVGWERGRRAEHAVMDDPAWGLLPLLGQLKGTAYEQLGTSGSGNHFVEWGSLTLEQDAPDLGLTKGRYLALLSHSGSRGTGARIAEYYTKVAMERHAHLDGNVKHLAWLDLDREEGAAYWLAMELAGKYAAANHFIIHERVLAAAGVETLAVVENHHNFAWREHLPDGSEVIVHRKGATPAGKGVLGVIPGSMGDPGYVVRGLGNSASINSAAHGAGRRMSRSEAFAKIDADQMARYLKKHNIILLGGSLDESPQAYKPIKTVMAAQSDLVEAVAEFMPRIVRMDQGGKPHRTRK
ncbi:MAG: RtcB family protein [Candidatus Promineifilaceae bacterium]